MSGSAWLRGIGTTIAAALLLAGLPASAAASTGGAATPAAASAPPASPSGSADPAPSAGTISLLAAQAAPRKSFYLGVRATRFTYTIASDQPSNDLRIDIVNTASGEVVKSFYRNDVAPGVPDTVRWDGSWSANRAAPNGRYAFRVLPQAGGRPARASTTPPPQPLSLHFALYGYTFPVLGVHDFGSSGSAFGAGRSGHTHQGHDVMAACGTPLVAARGGTVRYSGYQGAAGNYLVIDGHGTGLDTAYMHLLAPSPLQAGMKVRTGQPIGLVGRTGSASACHLHFEIWSAPGWYEGGSPLDPLPYLLRWDAYS